MVLQSDNVAARYSHDLERAAARGENHHSADRTGSSRRQRLSLAAQPERPGNEGDGQDGLTARCCAEGAAANGDVAATISGPFGAVFENRALIGPGMRPPPRAHRILTAFAGL